MENQNSSSRRGFIKKGSLAGFGLSTTFLSSYTNPHVKEEKKELGILSETSKKLLAQFGLKYPIFQAAPSGEQLAIAVANAGGMGALSLGWFEPDAAYDMVVRMKKATQGNFYANYVLHFGTKSLDRALEAGCPTVQFSWGIPIAETVKKNPCRRRTARYSGG